MKGVVQDTDTSQRECYGKIKAEMRMTLLEVREHQRWPANHQTQGERPGIDSLPWLLEGINSDDSVILVTADLETNINGMIPDRKSHDVSVSHG